jgi:hypothetical protein
LEMLKRSLRALGAIGLVRAAFLATPIATP